MPYIRTTEKQRYEPELDNLIIKIEKVIKTGMSKGELTYILYKIAKKAIDASKRSYSNISSVISCVDDTSHELKRAILDPYEDDKLSENGDV